MSQGNGEAELTFVLDPAEVAPDRAEVLRFLGYPKHAAAGARVLAKFDEAMEACRGKLQGRGMYAIHGVLRLTEDRMTLRGGARLQGAIGDFLTGAYKAAVFLATPGPGIVELAECAARRRDALGVVVCNAVGSHVAGATLRLLFANLRRGLEAGESLTPPYSPGFCGVPVSQQRPILRLLQADRIGVELLPALIVKPQNSICGIIGIGPEAEAYGNPCARCPNTDCAVRRESEEDL